MSAKNTLPALIVAFFVMGTSLAFGEQSASGVATVASKKEAKQLELTASTPQDHLRLAVYYRAQAQKFDGMFRYHEDMGEMYRHTPLPFDGKMPISMQRHCMDWAGHYRDQAERAAVLASLHEEKALEHTSTTGALELPSLSGLRNSGFGRANSSERVIQASPEQSSLFRESVAASIRFYDGTKILTYVVSAKGQPLIETSELRKSAVTLFDTHQQFLQSLADPQKMAIDSHLHSMQKRRRNVEKGLSELETASPHGSSYFKAARKIKQSLESWHVEQQQIGLQLGIQN